MLFAGCSGGSEAGAGRLVQHRDDWAAVIASLPPDPAEQAHILEAYRQQYGLPLLFAAGPDSAAVANSPLMVSDHACGPAIPAFVQTIPLDDPMLSTRFVLEVDSTANALLRWEVPLDVTVLGVSGTELLVSPGSRPGDVHFRVSPDGSFAVDAGLVAVDPVPVWPQGTCPNRPDFAELLCEEFLDSGRRRMLLHPPPCE